MAHLKDSRTGKLIGSTITEAQAKARELWERRKNDALDHLLRRQAIREQRTGDQQLSWLDKRLGVNTGAVKERLRLECRTLIDDQEASTQKKEVFASKSEEKRFRRQQKTKKGKRDARPKPKTNPFIRSN